jgi:hypothetical protein
VATFFFAKNFAGWQKYAPARAYLKHGKRVFSKKDLFSMFCIKLRLIPAAPLRHFLYIKNREIHIIAMDKKYPPFILERPFVYNWGEFGKIIDIP